MAPTLTNAVPSASSAASVSSSRPGRQPPSTHGSTAMSTTPIVPTISLSSRVRGCPGRRTERTRRAVSTFATTSSRVSTT